MMCAEADDVCAHILFHRVIMKFYILIIVKYYFPRTLGEIKCDRTRNLTNILHDLKHNHNPFL